jgi:hypothetical protein
MLKNLKVSERLMPRDITTQWNSTFDMLDFAITHRKALDLMTEDRANGLQDFELNDADWKIAQELQDALRVSCFQLAPSFVLTYVK